MTQAKVDQWLQHGKLPARLLLSGSGSLLNFGENLAAQLLKTDLRPISQGLNPDVRICADNQETLKIGDAQSPDDMTVRGLIKWLHQTPVSSHRVLILENLERTSRDAMQAWLKVLEEPPSRAQFILTTQNHFRLPETILSRVTVVSMTAENHLAPPTTEAQNFLESSDTITRFSIIEALDKAHKDNPQGIHDFMRELLTLARFSPQYQSRLPLLFETYHDLQRNVNRRLCLEHLALQLQKH